MTRCHWCGRMVADVIEHHIQTDTGPDTIVWCRDWRACAQAHAQAAPSRPRTWS